MNKIIKILGDDLKNISSIIPIPDTSKPVALSISETLDIPYYENNQKRQTQGLTGRGLNLNIKNRRDITLSPKEINLPTNKIFKTTQKKPNTVNYLMY